MSTISSLWQTIEAQYNNGTFPDDQLAKVDSLVYSDDIENIRNGKASFTGIHGYDETVILSSVKLNLVPGSRIGLLGRNGAGKSTLIKLLAQVHAPMSGDYQTSQGLDIGYFAQHQVETLDLDATPLLHLQRLDRVPTEQQHRDYLGGFGFQGDEATSLVGPMSGGEKARLVLALIVYQKPNLLLLDEPTNHLDLDMRDALNFALQGFTGAMVLVSHDRTLLASVCEDFYLVDSGAVEPFRGDLSDYTKWVLDTVKQEKAQEKADSKALAQGTEKTEPAIDRKLQKRLEAEFRQRTSGLRKDITRYEKVMETAQAKLADIESHLADPAVYEEAQKNLLNSLLAEQAKYSSQLDDAEMAWCDAQEQLEQEQTKFSEELKAG